MRSRIGYGVLGIAVAFLLATNPVVVNAAGLIGSAQIKNNSVKSKDIKNNNVKSADVKNNNLTGVDINESTLSNQTTGYRFRLPVTAASTAKVFNLAVPAGNYLVNYNVIATTTGPIRCILYPAATATVGESPTISSFEGGFATATGSAILQVTTGPPVLSCFGPSFTIYDADVISSVSFTRLDALNTPTATGGRPAVEGRGGAFAG